MRNPFRRNAAPSGPAASATDTHLADAVRSIATASGPEEALVRLAAAARAVIGSDGITIVRRDDDQVAYVTEDAISPLWAGQCFPIRTCVSGQALLARAPIFIPDIAEDKRVPLNAYVATFVRSMGVVPIGRDDPRYALGAYWRDAQPIAPIAIERMMLLADAVATVIDSTADRSAGRQVA